MGEGWVVKRGSIEKKKKGDECKERYGRQKITQEQRRKQIRDVGGSIKYKTDCTRSENGR